MTFQGNYSLAKRVLNEPEYLINNFIKNTTGETHPPNQLLYISRLPSLTSNLMSFLLRSYAFFFG